MNAPLPSPNTPNRKSGRISHGLVALSSAAVLAVYTAGYLRTQTAADRLAADAGQRRPAPLAPASPVAIRGEAPQLHYEPAMDLAPMTSDEDRAIGSPGATGEDKDVPAAGAPVPAATEAEVRQPVADRATPAPAGPVAAAAAAPGDNDDKVAKAVASTTPEPAPSEQATPQTVITDAEVSAGNEPAGTGSDATAATPAGPKYKDGTYTGWGSSRHGDIQAQVVIENGRIVSATIAQCLMRWPCSWIEVLPPQVVQRQSPETDFVSGATQSTNAFYYGVVQALGKATLP